MFKYKKKGMVVFLSTTLVCLCFMLLLCDNNTEALVSSTTVTSDFKVASNFNVNSLENVKNKEAASKKSSEENKENKDNKTLEEPKAEDKEQSEEVPLEDVVSNDEVTNDNDEEVEQEEIIVEPVVYEGMTMNELASKLERSMKNELSGYGYLYASYSLEKGVDPYLALAISLEETGCNWNCSSLVRSCHNVGGMKGSGCGAYGYFNSLDDGIRAFIDNIYRNYVAYGLTTADAMNPKYAENPAWSYNVNNYISIIRNN